MNIKEWNINDNSIVDTNITVGDILDNFSEEERNKIYEWFNETFYEIEFKSLKNFFLFIKQAARWENRDEVDEDDFEIMFEDPNDPNRVMGY